jgi:hypothetical protein
MCTIDATLGNLGVGKKFINTPHGLFHQFPTKNVISEKVMKADN